MRLSGILKIFLVCIFVLFSLCACKYDRGLILFNKQPNFLRDYEKIYFAKYLSKNCSFYEKGDDVYVAPSSAEKKDLNAFAIPDDIGERQSSDEYYSEMGIGYRNVRT